MIRKKPLAQAISLAIAATSLAANSQQPTSETRVDEDMIVTGTRIPQDTFSSSAPMDVISADQAFVQGINDVGRLLQTSTIAAGSAQITPAISGEFVTDGGVGASTLSLRGLGASRTLVLLNNRRAGPAGTRGAVSAFDLNVIPLSVIDRVEILKDGASSIYGSDAVAGVVNIITKKTDGISFDGYYSAPSASGGEESRFNFTWGEVGDRGSFQISADFYEQEELARGDRSYFECGEQFIFSPLTGNRVDVIDPRTNRPACQDLLWGHVWIYDYQDPATGNVPQPTGTAGTKAQFDYDGDLANYIPGFAVDPANPEFMVTPPGWFPVWGSRERDAVANADHPFQDQGSLIPKTERTTIFAEGELEFTDRMQGYMEVLLNRRETHFNDYRQYWSYIYNATGGGVVGANPINAGWEGAQWLSPTPITDHADDRIEVDYQRFVAGLRGDINDNWGWDVSYQRSESDGDYASEIIFDDSIWDQNWIYDSCTGTTTSVRGVPCIDTPWLDPQFLAGNVSQQDRDFLFGTEVGNTVYEQDSIEGFVTGTIGRLPAGSVSFAAGFQLQDDEIRDVPGEHTLAENVWGASVAGITAGKDTTTAIFAEFDVPLMGGKRGIESLDLTASVRNTDVDSYGSDSDYKFGLNWQISDGLRMRFNKGTSFRTPSLFELYLADQTGFLGQRFIDPCIGWQAAVDAGDLSPRTASNCAADGIPGNFTGGSISATIITGGGLGRLQAETSESETVGFVYTPPRKNLSFSMDWFDILVENEVDQIGAEQIVGGCYNSDFFPNDPLCNLFDRSGVNMGVDNIRDSYINIATQTNKGVDIALNWQTQQPWGTLTLDTQITRQTQDIKALFADTVTDFNGEIGEPKNTARLNVTVERGDWSYFWGMNYVGSASNRDSFGGDTATYRGETVKVVLDTDQIMYHAVSVSRSFPDKGIDARFGVANVFDEEPPQVTTLDLGEVDTVGNSAFYSNYDWFGRRYYVNFTKSFGE